MKKLAKDYKIVLTLVTFIGMNIFCLVIKGAVTQQQFVFSLVASAAMYLITYFLNF